MMSWLKKLKPIAFEDSKIPVWLSAISPINVNAISIGPFVLCRGKFSDSVLRHETIHFQQQLEMLFVFQWVMYALFYIVGRFRHGSWKEAYYNIPFELEAYDNQDDEKYLKNRAFWAWRKYIY